MALIRNVREAFRRDEDKFPKYGLTKKDFPLSFYTGHTKLSESPEIIAGINVIADHVSRMTIRLMKNTENGDKRLSNHISRKLDIEPNEYMTRKSFIYAITHSLLLDGNQVTLPTYSKDGQLDALHPIDRKAVKFFYLEPFGYFLEIKGKRYESTDVLHHTLNPTSELPYIGTGYKVPLKNLIDTLSKATKMKSTYMGGKYTPPIIVSVDASSRKLQDAEGRAEFLNEYVDSVGSGTPWVLPGGLAKIETVKPLTLKDVAINETVTLDKKTVAAILGIPAFLLGVGEWNKDEFNNFIETKVASIAEIIQQEWTKKLIEEPDVYVKFNARSLKSYDISSTASWAGDLQARGTISRNEVRDLIGFDPIDGLNELMVLENYIPADKIGDQKKLKDGGD